MPKSYRKGSAFDKPGPTWEYRRDMQEEGARRAAASDASTVGPLRAHPCCPRSLWTLSAAGLATDPAPDLRSHASWLMHYAW